MTIRMATEAGASTVQVRELGAKTQKSADEIQADFFRLLIAQMKNQDPLQPMDNAQVTQQMAQLSTLQGVQNMDASIKNLVDMYDQSASYQAAGMVGRQVLTESGALGLASGQAQGQVDLTGPAQVSVRIRNAGGVIVNTLDLGSLPSGVSSFVWNGQDANGVQMDDGRYTAELMVTGGAGTNVAGKLLGWGAVNAVALTETGTMLEVAGLGQVKLSTVRGFA